MISQDGANDAVNSQKSDMLELNESDDDEVSNVLSQPSNGSDDFLRPPVQESMVEKANSYLNGKSNITVSLYGKYLRFFKSNDIRVLKEEEKKT